MSLCESIDTLAMAYLDDELAAEERHELEAHLTECAACRAHLDGDRADQQLIQRSLVAPPVSDLFKARLSKALDAVDREEQRAQRRRWSSYLLPGSAVTAAVAAIALFIGMQTPVAQRPPASVSSAMKVTKRSLPLEVQGASTGPWLRANFAPAVDPPQFVDTGSSIRGARLLPGAFEGRDAALISYNVTLSNQPFVLNLLVVRDVRDDEWNEGQLVKVNGRLMHILRGDDGNEMVSYVDGNHMGYLFVAPEISTEQLVGLVSRTNLVGPQ